MNGLAAAFWAESLKVRKSKMLGFTILAALFMTLMMGFLMFVANHPELADKLGLLSAKTSLVEDADWPSYLGLLTEIMAGAGLVGFGFVTSWVFGREYSDRTVKDLLALPAPRSDIVLAKFAVVAIWCVLLAVIIITSGLAIGGAIGLTGWSGDVAYQGIYTFVVAALLTMLLCTPVAFLASYGRGYLPPLGFVILTVVLAQFIGVLGLGPYFPWAIPGLYSVSMTPGSQQIGVVSYVILVFTALIGLAATYAWWRYADQY